MHRLRHGYFSGFWIISAVTMASFTFQTKTSFTIPIWNMVYLGQWRSLLKKFVIRGEKSALREGFDSAEISLIPGNFGGCLFVSQIGLRFIPFTLAYFLSNKSYPCSNLSRKIKLVSYHTKSKFMREAIPSLFAWKPSFLYKNSFKSRNIFQFFNVTKM